jgi:hypothetical protein
MSRLCDPPSVKKIRAFGKKILGFNLPLQNPKYPGWQNQLHEIGHWAVIPPAILDEWMDYEAKGWQSLGRYEDDESANLPVPKRAKTHGLKMGSIPIINGLDLADFAAKKATSTWFMDSFVRTGASPGAEVHKALYAHEVWMGSRKAPRGGFWLKESGEEKWFVENAAPLIPNEWGVLAWCNQVCEGMGWPMPGKQTHWCSDTDPHQLLVAGIDIENGIFRPSHQYSISFLEVGPRLEICRPNTGEIVQSRTAHYWPGVFKPETEIVGKAYIWRA